MTSLKPITLQFSFQRDLGAELITWFSHGAGYSHVDAVEDDGTLVGARSDICQGVPAGVQRRPAGYADFARAFRVDIPVPPLKWDGFWEFIRQQIGKPYDMRAILGFATGRDWREPDSWFCSELMGAALEEAMVFTYLLATAANKLDPDDLLLALSALVRIGA